MQVLHALVCRCFYFREKLLIVALNRCITFNICPTEDTSIVQFVHISLLNAASFEIAQVVTTIADKPSLMRPDNIELSKLINLHNKSFSDETWTKYQ